MPAFGRRYLQEDKIRLAVSAGQPDDVWLRERHDAGVGSGMGFAMKRDANEGLEESRKEKFI